MQKMKALWSYEPFHQDTQRIKAMHGILSQVVKDANNLKVGFISTHTEPYLTLAFDVPESKRFTEYPKQQIKKELVAAKVKVSDSNVHVVEHQTYSTTKVVDQLLKLASDSDCSIIGLFTHARKGYARFLMGSFAETIMHRSKKDLLLLNPKANYKPVVKNILYASDFGPKAKSEFGKIFDYAKRFGAKLTIFHHAEVVYKWSLDDENPKVDLYRRKVEKMKKWIEMEARKHGVNVEVVIASDFNSTSSHVIKLVKKNKIDLVSVCAKTGPLASLMGGSVARQIVRESPVPVLIIKNSPGK